GERRGHHLVQGAPRAGVQLVPYPARRDRRLPARLPPAVGRRSVRELQGRRDSAVLRAGVRHAHSHAVQAARQPPHHPARPRPPAPSPRRCFELGRLTARILRESPWRVVLMASSSWSHAFLTAKNHFLYPDLEADRVLLEHLRAGDYETWRDLPLERLEASGQHEVLNWVCLAGAMAELGAKMELVDWVETWIFNAPKCQAIFR